MIAWITKYALTTGIIQHEGEISPRFPNMFVVKGKDPLTMTQHFHGEGKEWHRTKQMAVLQAEEMRLNKIRSLSRAIAKLEAKTFA